MLHSGGSHFYCEIYCVILKRLECHCFLLHINCVIWVIFYKHICRGSCRQHSRSPHLFSLNYNMRLLQQPCLPFWLSKPITARSPSPCKWQPPGPPFALALVMGWYPHAGTHRTCAWHPSIKGLVHPTLCSLFE